MGFRSPWWWGFRTVMITIAVAAPMLVAYQNWCTPKGRSRDPSGRR